MKRQDLQGLRGLAIGSVLLFHFFPKICPNGYVGVDQFFVLSGFLMTMIFGSKPITLESCGQFYWRRIKRIVPLYLFIVLIVVVSIFIFYPNTFIGVNMESATNAILFYTNMAKRSEDNAYFLQLEQADDVFTHTWSLGVEMQFYLFAPPIFFILRESYVDVIFTILYLASLFACSLGYHLMANSSTAFNNVFCRMWQFEIGMIAFNMSESLRIRQEELSSPDKESLLAEEGDDDDMIAPKKRSNFQTSFNVLLLFSLVTLVVCALWPLTLFPTAIRVLTTVFTGLAIVFGTVVERNPLSNGALVYFGDISYAVYLVHWPIFVWVKFNYPDQTSVYILAILFSCVLAILISETFEKWYLKLGKLEIVTLLTVFYVLIVLIIVQKDHLEEFADSFSGIDDISTTNGTIPANFSSEDAIRMNTKFDREEWKTLRIPNCFPNKTEHGFCEFEKKSLNGKLDIFLLGNSYTPNMGKLAYDSFAKYAKNMTKYSESYCEVLFLARKHCEKQQQHYLSYVDQIRPDVLFIITRHMASTAPIKNNKVASDPYFLEALHTLQKYESLVKRKVFILDAIPSVPAKHMKHMKKMIEEGGELEIGPQKFQNAQIRMAELQKRCDKCEVFGFNGILTDSNGEARVFDPDTKVSYYTSGVHLTPAGKEAVRPVFRKLAANFEKEYEKWNGKV